MRHTDPSDRIKHMINPVSLDRVSAVGFAVERLSLPARDLTAAIFSSVGLKLDVEKSSSVPRPSMTDRA